MGSTDDGQTVGLASKILISDGMTPWQPVPSWTAFFLSLGERVALAHEGGLRVTVVVVPPVRCFAAATAATAAVVTVASRAEAVPDVEEHFSVLARLPLGTPLVVKMGSKIYAAKFAGVEDRGQGPGIRAVYDGMTHYIPKQLCQRVQVGAGGKRTLPRGSPRSSQSDFGPIAAIVGRKVATEFVSVPTVDVVLVGHVDLLSQELSLDPPADMAFGCDAVGVIARHQGMAGPAAYFSAVCPWFLVSGLGRCAVVAVQVR